MAIALRMGGPKMAEPVAGASRPPANPANRAGAMIDGVPVADRGKAVPAPAQSPWDPRRIGRLAVASVSLAIGLFLPGPSLPFTIAGLYMLTRESKTVQGWVRSARERFPETCAKSLKVAHQLEAWVKDTRLYRWATRQVGASLPPVTQELDDLTRPPPPANDNTPQRRPVAVPPRNFSPRGPRGPGTASPAPGLPPGAPTAAAPAATAGAPAPTAGAAVPSASPLRASADATPPPRRRV